MCVEVLTTVSRKHGLFSMDVCHVGHMLHIPAALFQNFHQHSISKASRPSDSFMVLEEQNSHSEDGVNFFHVDHQFIINLFIACCQLLCTIIRHRPSECKQCVAHLEAFVTVLLNCFETVLENNKSTVNEGWFSWEVEEEVEINTAAIIPGSMQNLPRNSSGRFSNQHTSAQQRHQQQQQYLKPLLSSIPIKHIVVVTIVILRKPLSRHPCKLLAGKVSVRKTASPLKHRGHY